MNRFIRALLTLALTALIAMQVSLVTPALSAPTPESATPCHSSESPSTPNKGKPVVSAHLACCSVAVIVPEPVLFVRLHSHAAPLRPSRDNRPVSFAPYEVLRPPNALL
ncbi:hypothetical protein [Asticcacaulis tiandongensis]|uniref:hypothetical protein n=1 Tax=Asticcacaulis tiandongensis TaxID=2565365 RepID=UPI00112A401E|nr:hypothetical protein [Asticcacaulis tiandongensis]